MVGLKATNSYGDFEVAPAGNHPAVCVSVIDIGLQEGEYMGVKSTKQQCIVYWELPGSLMEDGRPHIVTKWYTVTTSSMGTMRADFESWRGKDFTEDEINEFEVFNIAGSPCLLNCVAGKKQSGGDKITISSITPLPAAMAHLVGNPHNPIVTFSIEDYKAGDQETMATFLGLPDWQQEKIKSSPSFTVEEEARQDMGDKDEIPAVTEFEDDDLDSLPF